MTYRRLPADLPDRLRKAGLKVVVIDGWRTRGRPASTGAFKPVGSLNHHTGSYDKIGDTSDDLSYAKWMFLTGRGKALPPPLCQLALSLEGVVYVGASGRANHAGKAKASGSVSAGDGNALYVGTEWMLSGTQPIPKGMYDAGVKLNGVLMDVLGNSVETISCHYQTSVTGKWDIGDPNGIPFKGQKVLDVPKFRRAVKDWRASRNAPAKKTSPPPPPKTAPGHNPYPPAIIGGAVYHKSREMSYAAGCNFETIRVASASSSDYEGIDLDLNVSMEKTAWGTHNTHPTRGDAWYDPKKLINDSHSIVKLPDSDINRLVVDYRGDQRPIRTAQELAKFCRDVKPRKLIPCFEAKHSGQFLKEEWWEEFKKSMPAGSTPIIMSLPVGKNNFGIRKLAAAHAVGLPTMLLWREDARPYMPGWEKHVDLVKSRPGRGIYAVT